MSSAVRIGPYEVLEVAGRGGMGTVYRARHSASGEVVALKTVHAVRPDLADYLRLEVERLARVDHPQIVSVVDHGVEAGRPWLAMAWLQGEGLIHGDLKPSNVRLVDGVPILVDFGLSRAVAPYSTVPDWWAGGRSSGE